MSASTSTALAPSISAFAFDLYRTLSDQPGNLFVAPADLARVLAMAYAGARGRTADQMAHALHLPSAPEEMHAAFATFDEVVAQIQERGQVRLDTASSIWPHAEHPLLAEYLKVMDRYYKASVLPVDYRDGAAAAQHINGWVSEQTQGLISHVVDPGLDPLTRLILVTAIYFRGRWEHPFDEDVTRDERFWIGRRKSVRVPMMRQMGTFRYAQRDGLQILDLPYAGEQVAMLVLLPAAKTGLARLEQALTAHDLEQYHRHLQHTTVEVLLPRFRVRTDVELCAQLRSLGMHDAFDAAHADFSGIDGRERSLYISWVIHRAFIDTDEAGTEAAAASAIGMALGTPGFFRQRPVTFRADHPFLVVIRERSTGTILFLGRVENPQLA